MQTKTKNSASDDCPLTDTQRMMFDAQIHHPTSTRKWRHRRNSPPIVPIPHCTPSIPSHALIPDPNPGLLGTRPRTQHWRTPSSTFIPIISHFTLSTHILTFPLPFPLFLRLLSSSFSRAASAHPAPYWSHHRSIWLVANTKCRVPFTQEQPTHTTPSSDLCTPALMPTIRSPT